MKDEDKANLKKTEGTGHHGYQILNTADTLPVFSSYYIFA